MTDNPPPDLETLNKRHPHFFVTLNRFNLHIDALRGMLDDVVPVVEERDKQRLGSPTIAKVAALSPADQLRLQGVLESVVQQQRRGEVKQQPVTASTDDAEAQAVRIASDHSTEAAHGFDGLTTEPRISLIKRLGGNEGATDDSALSAVILDIFREDKHSFASFAKRLARAIAGPNRTTIVLESLLMQACAAFEVLVSGLAARYYATHTGALGSDKKEFSLAELQAFPQLNDAVDALVARRVSQLMYGGLDDWARWFKADSKVDMHFLAMDWESVREVFQRRHLITHTGGVVSQQYLDHVKVTPAPKVGSMVRVNADYLRNACDELEALGTLLAVHCWGAWAKEERESAAGILLDRSYELMMQERWSAVEHVTKVGATLRCPSGIKVPLQCNLWCSRKEQQGVAVVEEEVRNWDTDTLAMRFQLVKHVLLDELEPAAALVPRMIGSGELTLGQLREWPILRALRDFDGLDVSSLDSAGTSSETPR